MKAPASGEVRSDCFLSYHRGRADSTVKNDEFAAIVDIFFAGAAEKDGKLVTSGGRVLGVTAVAEDLRTALDAAYKGAKQIGFEGAYMRSDIGARALRALEEQK